MPWVTPPAGGGEGHMEAGWGPGVGKEDVSILVPSYHIHARHPLASWAPPPWVPSPGSSLSLSTSCSVSPSCPAPQAGVWTQCLHRNPHRLSHLLVLNQTFPVYLSCRQGSVDTKPIAITFLTPGFLRAQVLSQMGYSSFPGSSGTR